MTDINIVFLGEIDAGKSTLINYLANLFENGSLNNLKVAIPTRYLAANFTRRFPSAEENFSENLTTSRTKQCGKYSFLVENVSLNFFDTPGFSTDDQTINAIIQCLASLEHLSALVLVFNGSQSRLTSTFRSVLQQLHDRIPDLFSTNFLVIFTHCTAYTVNFDSMKFFDHLPKFYMQNLAFASDPQTWTRETRIFLERDWNQSIQTLNQFLEVVLRNAPVPTNSISKQNDQRNHFRSILHQTRLTIHKLRQIEEELMILGQTSNDSSEINERIQMKTIQVNEVTPTSYHNTLCLQCNTVCHERCTLNEVNHCGEDLFRRCSVMNNGRCTVCPNRCPFDRHYHDRRLIKPVQRTVKFALTSSDHPSKFQSIQEMKTLLEHSFDEQWKTIEKSVQTLKWNIAEDLTFFINMLEKDVKTFRSKTFAERVQKFIEQLKTLTDEDQRIPKKKPKLKIKRDRSTMFAIEPNYGECSTEYLISLIEQSNERIRLITEELTQRCLGKSIGYLSPSQLSTLCEYYASYRLLSSNELHQLHSQHQMEIQRITEENPTEILSAPIDTILQSLAIQFCLQNSN